MAKSKINPEQKRAWFELLDLYSDIKSQINDNPIDSFIVNRLLEHEQTEILEQIQTASKDAGIAIIDKKIAEIKKLLEN